MLFHTKAAELNAAATTIILSNQWSVETVDTNIYTHVIYKLRNGFSLFCLSKWGASATGTDT
jgi:hypothetical protein